MSGMSESPDQAVARRHGRAGVALVCGIGSSLLASLVAAAPVAERMTGILGRAHGNLAFAPCEGPSLPAVDHTAPGALSELLDWLLAGQDGAVRVELDAWRDDAGWQVVHLRRAGHDEPTCVEDGTEYVWQAVGDRGWRLVATPRSVRFHGIEGLDGQRFPFRPFVRRVDGSYAFEATAGREPLEVVLTPASCRRASDTLRGSMASDYRVTLRWRGLAHEGCAYNGKAE